MRIVGVGPSYARLLEAAGVDSVPELAQRNPAHLHAALDATDAEKSIVRQSSLSSAAIVGARALPCACVTPTC